MAKDGRPRKAGQHHGDLRRALLTAATDVLIAEGASGVSLREVARRAGVTAAAPYHHFADKGALLAALAEDGFRALDEALDEAVCGIADPETRLGKMVSTYVRFACAHGPHYKLMFPGDPAAGGEHLGQVAMASFQRLAFAVAAVRPEADHDEVRLSATMLWALCHGLATLRIDGVLGEEGPLPAFEALVERAARTAVPMAKLPGLGAQIHKKA